MSNALLYSKADEDGSSTHVLDNSFQQRSAIFVVMQIHRNNCIHRTSKRLESTRGMGFAIDV